MHARTHRLIHTETHTHAHTQMHAHTHALANMHAHKFALFSRHKRMQIQQICCKLAARTQQTRCALAHAHMDARVQTSHPDHTHPSNLKSRPRTRNSLLPRVLHLPAPQHTVRDSAHTNKQAFPKQATPKGSHSFITQAGGR